MTAQERIAAPGPKKILALDGGGIRGILTIEILAAIEKTLRERQSTRDMVLSDYFDFVAGTSTGAIISTCISLGMSVDAIRKFYIDSGAEMFDKAFFLKLLHHKYNDEKLRGKLQEVIGKDTTLGSDKLRTLLLLVMRNATTDSPWLVTNNPAAKYNRLERRQNPGDCNLDIPLWQLVRASTAAPVFFPPEEVQVGKKKFIFVDGGITTYNNPSFAAFLTATVEPYNVNWKTGEQEMLVVSVGTGVSPDANENLDASDMNLVYNASRIPAALMFAASSEQDLLCRTFGRCVSGMPIDREVGDMIDKRGPVHPKLFTYMRFNAELSKQGLHDLELADINPKDVQKMDSVEHIDKLQRVGRAVGNKFVRPECFSGFLQ
ncbi:MAG: patatin-like phospholipase family protein [Bacteroidetes bacterium]|nr:patatin-like phospholipase family protein [Bacteroidota bacterium]MCW5897260.1 patatin-like phospholipase family protein [Bacteroidota bacterium]